MAEAAKSLKITTASLSHIERGERTPGRDLLFRLAKFYATSTAFIESGAVELADRVREAKLNAWPVLVYVVATQIATPRLWSIDELLGPDNALAPAFAEAFKARHVCEFLTWVKSVDGDRIRNTEGLEHAIAGLLSKASSKGKTADEAWLAWAANHEGGLPFWPETDEQGRHLHIFSNAARNPPEGERYCFSQDRRFTTGSFKDFPACKYGSEPDADVYTDPLNSGFILAAFPSILWSVAKNWSDRRIAGWLWYLAAGEPDWMPLDVFAPLIRLARQYEDDRSFLKAAAKLLEQVSLEDADAFLSIFPDIYWQRKLYAERYSPEEPFPAGMIVIDHRGAQAPGSGWARKRRRELRLVKARAYMKVLSRYPEALRAAESHLDGLMPPYRLKHDDTWLEIYVADASDTPPMSEPDQPPESLP